MISIPIRMIRLYTIEKMVCLLLISSVLALAYLRTPRSGKNVNDPCHFLDRLLRQRTLCCPPRPATPNPLPRRLPSPSRDPGGNASGLTRSRPEPALDAVPRSSRREPSLTGYCPGRSSRRPAPGMRQSLEGRRTPVTRRVGGGCRTR